MGLLVHPLFKELSPYLYAKAVRHDGATRKPRLRWEWRGMPDELAAKAVVATMPCPACGDAIHFVRARGTKQRGEATAGLYYAATCSLGDKIACSRGKAATAEYESLRAWWKGHQ